MTIRNLLGVLAAIAALLPVGWSQAPIASEPLAFDVASIKANKREQRMTDLYSPAGYMATDVSLRWLIHAAYGIANPWGPSHHLAGGPGWLDSERFDVAARVGSGVIPADLPPSERNEGIRLMLQALLAERFQLKVHRETRQLPVYALLVAKNGPKLKKASLEEKECPGIPIGFVSCRERFSGGMGRGVRAKAVDLDDFAQYISGFTDRPIIDKTGVKGLFEIDTSPWRPSLPNVAAEPIADPDTLPTIFTMLQEQLGLRLESTKGPVDVLVIDSVQRPSEN